MTAASVVSTTSKNPPLPSFVASEEDNHNLFVLRICHLHQKHADRHWRQHHHHVAAKDNAVRHPRHPPTSVKKVLTRQHRTVGAAGSLDSHNPSPCGLIDTSSFSVVGPAGSAITLERTVPQDASLSTSRCYHTALIDFGPGGDGGEGSENCSNSSDRSGGMVISSWSKPHKSNDAQREAIYAAMSRDGALEPRHFQVLKKLWCTRIGTVFLVELCGTKFSFAMKVVNKKALARRKMLSQAQMEREILECLDHPFLPSLYAYFDTESHSCLVMEYCPGGNLYTLREKQPGKCFSEQAARHYAAEMLLALEYLHTLGIVYRGLKPENVMLKDDGHIMLSDFDLSLRCAVPPYPFNSSDLDLPRPESMACCCAPLLAPEIIKGEKHGSAVDWWSLGVLLYELLFGKKPFRGAESRDGHLSFPETPTVSFAARDLIRGLLVMEARQRIAFRRGAVEVKQHPFFQGVNWALVRSTTPPSSPKW